MQGKGLPLAHLRETGHCGMQVSMPGDSACYSAAHNFQQTATTGVDRHASKAAGHSWQNVAHASAAPQDYEIGVHASKAAGQTWQVQGSQPVSMQVRRPVTLALVYIRSLLQPWRELPKHSTPGHRSRCNLSLKCSRTTAFSHLPL